MKNAEGHIKINIRVPKRLFEQFSHIAVKQGVSKADVLRQWLETLQETITLRKKAKSDERVSYSCSLSKETYQKVTEFANQLEIPINTYIVALIQKKVFEEDVPVGRALRVEKYRAAFDDTWNYGDLGSIHSNFLDTFDLLSFDQQFLYIKTELETGRFSLAHDILESLRKKSLLTNNKKMLAYVDCYDSFYQTHYKRDFIAARASADRAWEYGLHTKDRVLLGATALKKGVTYVYDGGMTQTRKWEHRALAIFDPITQPFYFIDAQISSLRSVLMEADTEEAQKIISSLMELLSIYPNKYLETQMAAQIGVYYYLLGEYSKSKDYFNKSCTLGNQVGSVWVNVNNYQKLGTMYLLQQKKREAAQAFETANALEVSIRPHFKYGRSWLLTSYLHSFVNYDHALQTLAKVQNNKVTIIQPEVEHYVRSVIQFTQGNTVSDRKHGEETLRRLAQTGGYAQIRKAAEVTLQTKQIGPLL